MEKIEVSTRDGNADAFLFCPEGKEEYPLIILFMDAFGPRPALFGIAENLSAHDFSVLIPNLFYRFGDYEPFDPSTAFTSLPSRERIMGMISSLSIPAVMSDIEAFLDKLNGNKRVNTHKVGTLGYCMGGKFAVACGYYLPGRVLASASIHGGGLVTNQPDSPHLGVPGIRGRLYIGAASNDRSFTAEQFAVLEKTIADSRIKGKIELYPDGFHGFAIKDSTVYNPEAAERHWQRILTLFNEELR